jgi:hypothetical protein
MDGWMDGWCAGGCWFTLACNKEGDVNIYVGGMAFIRPWTIALDPIFGSFTSLELVSY